MPAFKLKDIKRSARAQQERWLINALQSYDPKEVSDEELHIAQMFAHAMEIKDQQDAYEKIKRAKLEWKVMRDMMEEADKEKQYAQTTTKNKTKAPTKKPRKAPRKLGTGDRTAGHRPKTQAPRKGNSRKK